MYFVSFQLSWKNLCGGIIEVEGNGSIISPNYPKTYLGDLNCNYTLISPPYRTIYGKFEEFAVEKAFGEGISLKIKYIPLDDVSLAA